MSVSILSLVIFALDTKISKFPSALFSVLQPGKLFAIHSNTSSQCLINHVLLAVMGFICLIERSTDPKKVIASRCSFRK
jgi:hypothetical protein